MDKHYQMILDDRPAFMKIIESSNDILELDGFVVRITDSNSCNIKFKKGGNKEMKEELQKLIEAYKKDLEEAKATREAIKNENVEAKIDAKLDEKRKEISDTLYAEHDANLADANKTIELMNIIIARKENQLAELVANEQIETNEQVETNETINEGV